MECVKIDKFVEVKKEIEDLQNKRTLFRLRREAILKVFEYNNYIKNVDEKFPLKPIIPALYYSDVLPVYLTPNNAKRYDNDIEIITRELAKLNKELRLLVEKQEQ